MKNLIVKGALQLYGNVGAVWDDDGFTASDVAISLAEHGEGDVTVHVNSGGGIATEGMAIYSLLKSHAGKINVVVDGVAASAASLIAMAGDAISIRDGAMLMIHDPSTITIGNAAEHEKNTAFLHKLADNYAGVYARAAGIKPAAARDIMKAETWYTAQEAVKAGFASKVIADASVAKAEFDYRIYMHAPADLPRRPARPNSPTMITKGSGMTTMTDEDVKDKPWTRRFMLSAEKSGLPLADLNAIVEASDTIEIARDSLLAKMAAKHNGGLPGPGGTNVHGGGDQTFDNPDFFAQAASDMLYARMKGAAPQGAARQLASYSLLDIGVMAANMGGKRINRGDSKHNVATAVMAAGGGHTTSDFPNLLQGAGSRFLLEVYQAAQSPLKQLARKRTADDFRAINVLRLGEAPSLLPVLEGAEVKSGTAKESKETYGVLTFAREFSLSRQAIVNDDLSAFADWGRRWGLAAAMLEADQLAALFTANSGDGALLSDGAALYTTTRGNKLTGAGSALSATSLDSGRQVLRNTKGLDGTTLLNLPPAFLVVGSAIENTARQLASSQVVPTKVTDVNTFAGQLTPLVEPRFAGNSWRLFTDPNVLPVMEIAYLNGQEGPIVRQREGWNVLGIDMMALMDVGVGLVEYRGTVYGVGS